MNLVTSPARITNFRRTLLSELIAQFRSGNSPFTWDDAVFLRSCRVRLERGDTSAWTDFEDRLRADARFLDAVAARIRSLPFWYGCRGGLTDAEAKEFTRRLECQRTEREEFVERSSPPACVRTASMYGQQAFSLAVAFSEGPLDLASNSPAMDNGRHDDSSRTDRCASKVAS